jgi:hypothetical protein
LARKRCIKRRRIPDHFDVRRAAYGGARLCQPELFAPSGRIHIGLGVPTFIYHCGDFDPSGQDAARAIEQTLREMAPKAEIHFERLAVTPEQIRQWRLPTRPTKQSDSRAKGFGDISVELDAIPPDQLRSLVQGAIERHLPPVQYEILKVAEKSEQRLIHGLIGMAKAQIAGGAE